MWKDRILIAGSVVCLALGLYLSGDAHTQTKRGRFVEAMIAGDKEYARGNYEGAVENYLKGKGMTEEHKPLLNLKLSNAYFQLGEEEFSKAIDSSKYGLSSFNTNTEAAHSYYEKSLTALDEFDEKTIPSDLKWRYHYNKANLFLRKTILSNANPGVRGKKETMRLYNEAVESYKLALDLRPSQPGAEDKTLGIYTKQNLEYITHKSFLERSRLGKVMDEIKMELNSMNKNTDRKSKLKLIAPEAKKLTKRGGTTGIGGDTGLK